MGNFCEDNLADYLSRASKVYPRLKNCFRRSSDGTSPGTTTLLDRTLTFMHIGSFINYTPSFQRSYVTRHGRNLGMRDLEERYGANILDELRPFAEYVWSFK